MHAEDLTDRVVPDLETRMEEVVHAFRENHRHPVNLLLHAIGYVLAARGGMRVLRGRLWSGFMDASAAAGLLLVGHRIEGNEPGTTIQMLRASREPRQLP